MPYPPARGSTANIGVCVKLERIFRYHVVISNEKSSRQELMLAKWVHVQLQACQTSADPRNSAVFDFPGVIFVIRPDPMRK